jgi:hypothetical protein
LETARDFFSLMRQSGATLRLVSGDRDRSFGTLSVERAAERAISTAVEDAEEIIRGHLSGVLPESHQFEFRAGERGTLRGNVDRALTTDQLETFNRELVHVDTDARVRVRRVRREGAIVREAYTLLELVRPIAD